MEEELKEEQVEDKKSKISNLNLFLIILLVIQIIAITIIIFTNSQKHNREWCRSHGYGPNLSVYKGN